MAEPRSGEVDITVSDEPSWDSSEDFTDIPSTPGDEEEEDPDWEEEGSEDLDIDSLRFSLVTDRHRGRRKRRKS